MALSTKLPLSELKLTKETRTFIRVDFNVPLPVTQDAARIAAALDTIRWCVEKGGRCVIGSHLGRPDGQKNMKVLECHYLIVVDSS